MTAETLSIREASDMLGVSQIRIRELIRKGRLEAEKVDDPAGERWTIRLGSAQSYLRDRPVQPVNGNGTGAASASRPPPNGRIPTAAATSPVVAELITGLERQLGRITRLADEILRVQGYLDGLRHAQRTVEAELKQLRAREADLRRFRTGVPAEPVPPSQDVVAAPVVVAVAEPAPVAEATPDEVPEASPPRKRAPRAKAPAKPEAEKPPKSATALGHALHEAGVAGRPTSRKAPKAK